MAKYDRPIKVIVKGELTDELKKEYNRRLAIALYAQFGREACIELLEALKNEKEDTDEKK